VTMNYGAHAVVAVVVGIAAAVAAVVALNPRPMLVADLGGEDVRSMDSVANEGGRRMVRHRRLKVREEGRAGGLAGVEA
jgi:hypothetical protein